MLSALLSVQPPEGTGAILLVFPGAVAPRASQAPGRPRGSPGLPAAAAGAHRRAPRYDSGPLVPSLLPPLFLGSVPTGSPRTRRLAPYAHPLTQPTPSTSGGRVRGEPIGTNFGTPITISAPPSPPSPAWPCPPKGQGQAWGGRAGRGAAYHGHTEIRTHRLAPYARRPPPHPAHGNLAGIARPCTR